MNTFHYRLANLILFGVNNSFPITDLVKIRKGLVVLDLLFIKLLVQNSIY